MKVLQIHNRYLEPGGEDGVVLRERELLVSRGASVENLEFKNPDSAKGQMLGLAQASWNRSSAKRVREHMAGHQFDIVHVHNTWYEASPSAVVEARRHAPVVATLHNYRRVCLNAYLYRDNGICTDCVGSLPWRGIQHGCYRGSRAVSVAIGVTTAVNRATSVMDNAVDRFLVLSDFAAELAVRSGVPEVKVVRHDNFVPDPGQRVEQAVDSSIVLAVGRLSPEKGFLDLVRAWKADPPKGLKLRLVGDGPMRAEIEALAGSDVEIMGRLPADEVAAQMRSCRALLFPSRWFEGQPLVILEALAAGLPVLSSDHPPLREVLGTLDQHLVTDERWGEAFELVTDDAWVRNASRSAREGYLNQYTPEVAGKRLTEIYEQVRL